MSDYGLKPEGFVKKRLDVILKEEQDKYREAFGANFTLDDASPFGNLSGLQAKSLADLWDLAQLSFTSFSPSQSRFSLLDDLCEFSGITRNQATLSTVILQCSGTDGSQISVGDRVQVDDTGSVFEITQEGTIQSGYVLVPAQAIEVGPVVAAPNTINTIVTSIPGWDAVTNPEAAKEGTFIETDEDLRLRRDLSVANSSSTNVDAIFTAVSDLDGTEDTLVLENKSSVTDGNGLQPNSFEVIVQGGEDADIALAILRNHPCGIYSNGGTIMSVPTKQGFPTEIRFTRPTSVEIQVEVNITAFADFPGNGEDLIKQNIVDYANGILVKDRGFSSGDNVILSELYTPINLVPGSSVVSVEICRVGQTLGTDNLPMSLREVALFVASNIEVVQA